MEEKETVELNAEKEHASLNQSNKTPQAFKTKKKTTSLLEKKEPTKKRTPKKKKNQKKPKKNQQVVMTKELILAIVVILIGILVVIGTSYAVYTTVAKGTKEQIIVAGTFQVDFEEGSQVVLNNAYPISDAKGLQTDAYTFKITNSGSVKAMYRVKLEEDTSNPSKKAPSSAIKVSYKQGDSTSYSTPKLVSSLESGSIIVTDQLLDPGTSIGYEIKMWVDEAAGNEVMGKEYKTKIVVEAVQALDGDINDGNFDDDYVKDHLLVWYDGANPGTNSTTWQDLSGNGNDGKLNNFSQTSTSGFVDNGLKFNGSNNYVSLTKNPIYNEEQYTISVLVNFDNVTATQTLFCNRSLLGSGRSIFLIGGKMRIDNDNRNQWSSNYAISAQTKQLITVTRSSSSIDLYVDDQLVGTNTNIGSMADSHNGITTIGASQTNGTGMDNYLKGSIYDYKIYNKALTKDEIQKNYSNVSK